MDDTEVSLGEEMGPGEAEPDLDAPVKAEPIRPSVYGNTLGAGQAHPRPRKPPWRVFVYVFAFACLVALSLVLKSSNSSGGAPNPSSSPSGNVLLPGKTAPPPTSGQSNTDSAFAQSSCHRSDVLQTGFTLVRGFTTNAGTAAAWEDALSQGSSTSPLQEFPPDTKVAVCYIDGPWQPPQNVVDFYKNLGAVVDRAITIVPETGSQIFTEPYAPHDSLPVVQPASPSPTPSPSPHS